MAEFKKAVENKITKKRVRNYCLVSNKDGTDDDFENLRKKLLQTAQTTPSWDKSRPARWIYLEKSLLEEINSGQFILSKEEILQIAAKTNQPIHDAEEVENFLRYHHGIGTYLYFKDLPDYVVLFPQWLANAFKCIVFADMFQVDVSIIDEWDQFRKTGKLSDTLLESLFACQSQVFKDHRKHILGVMEKFDIIVRPKIQLESKEIIQKSNFFVPCMIKTKDLNEVIDIFECESKSSWLCIEFEFLPPSLVTCLLIAYSRELTVVTISSSKSIDGKELVFYSNFALFHGKNEGEMLLIADHGNTIQMQVWKWQSIKRSYSDLRKELDEYLQRLSRLFQMKLRYNTKLKCSSSPLTSRVGMKNIELFEGTSQYFCQTHNAHHNTDELVFDWIGAELGVKYLLLGISNHANHNHR